MSVKAEMSTWFLNKGYVLDIRKVQEKIGKNIISIYHEKIRQRKRLLAKCLLCCEFEEAKKFSKNGLVYIAHGVRCDTEEKKNYYLFSNSHQAAAEAKELKLKWENLDMNHSWLKVIKKENQATVENLIQLVIAVYNDSKLLTPSAWSWPS